MGPTTLSLLIGLAVVVMLFTACLALVPSRAREAEQRLEGLSGARRKTAKADPKAGILLRPQALDSGGVRSLARLLPSLEGIAQLYEQADVGLPFHYFLYVPVALMAAGAGLALVLGFSLPALLLAAVLPGAIPFLWLLLRKRKRIKQFTAQMPDALELVGRALRAGHGLAAGLHVVAEEMAPPIAVEFGRVYEEQNLGIPLEDSLRNLAERVPTMDVRFFVTAIVIQRSTGGDLAEILDKIGRLIRERFQIMGAVQALTGEGRLSGVVLLALPPALLAFTYMTNPNYAGLLFTTPMGTKMLAVAAVLQAVGAIAIKKIITIKV